MPTSAENSSILRVEDIHTFLASSHILQGVSLDIESGTIVALLGRNGVGKSTTLKSIMGITPPQMGSILFKGEEILGERLYKTCRRGIGYVPEERRIFPNLTVRENLLVGVRPSQKIDKPWTVEKVFDYFPQLKMRDRQKGGHLSGGEQQMLSIARTLMGNPELMLIDEPTEGLAPQVVDLVKDILWEIKKEGRSILLVEHAIDVALGLASRAYIMSKGQIVFQGSSDEVNSNEEIRRRYLEV